MRDPREDLHLHMAGRHEERTTDGPIAKLAIGKERKDQPAKIKEITIKLIVN